MWGRGGISSSKLCLGRMQARDKAKWARSAFFLHKSYSTKGLPKTMYMLFPLKIKYQNTYLYVRL